MPIFTSLSAAIETPSQQYTTLGPKCPWVVRYMREEWEGMPVISQSQVLPNHALYMLAQSKQDHFLSQPRNQASFHHSFLISPPQLELNQRAKPFLLEQHRDSEADWRKQGERGRRRRGVRGMNGIPVLITTARRRHQQQPREAIHDHREPRPSSTTTFTSSPYQAEVPGRSRPRIVLEANQVTVENVMHGRE